ncbi:MAG: putative sulfate/molybdate transporter [Syntrophomonadaceae bacterium]
MNSLGNQVTKTEKPINIGGELAGSIGDLGTLLPFVIGAITFASLDTTSVLFTFGLMYIFTAWFYQLPVPVQPMKVIGAAILVQHLTAGEIAAAGLLTGLCLLGIALSGITERIAQWTPKSVTMGIQSGLGISLALLGIKMVSTDWLLGSIVMATILILLSNRRFPASIVALIGGTTLAFLLNPEIKLPHLIWGISLPHFIWPAGQDFYRGCFQAFLPQLPLTLTNSVLVTSFLASELFPDQSKRVTNRNLCLTLGIGNLMAAPLGGIPLCHGSGGLAAHYRFGARTKYATLFIGMILILIAVLLGSSGLQIMQMIPAAVLGGLLFYSGLDLIKPIVSDDRCEVFVFTIVLVLSVAINPGIAFVIGLPLLIALRRGWIKT